MKVAIIEDETRAINHLERVLKVVAPEMYVVARIESVRDALEVLPGLNVDLIFSDVQLADGLSFEIYHQLNITCPIIFTTAYDHYAIEAFETNGIDYILKPVEEERLKKAIDKTKSFTTGSLIEKLIAMTEKKSARSYKSRFIVRIGEKIKVIPVEEIATFYSLERGTYIHTTGNRDYGIDLTLDQLEDVIDPERFFRINRKYIISLNSCDNIIAWSNSRLKLKIAGLEDYEIIVARERVHEFRSWLDH
jgi:DNA-binding LytR/AlgR family response regulator